MTNNSGFPSYVTSGLEHLSPVLASHQKQLEDIFDRLNKMSDDIADASSACQLKDMELASTVKNNVELLSEIKVQIIANSNKIASIELDISRFKDLDYQISKKRDADATFWRNVLSSLLVVTLTVVVVNPAINNIVQKATTGK